MTGGQYFYLAKFKAGFQIESHESHVILVKINIEIFRFNRFCQKCWQIQISAIISTNITKYLFSGNIIFKNTVINFPLIFAKYNL